MGRKHAFGELELSILNILRDKGPATVSDVLHVLANDSRYTTVMTVMSRLVEKGELLRQKRGKQYEYWIHEQGTQNSLSLFDRLKEKAFGGKALSMVSYLLESTDTISDEELEQIEDLIRSERKARDNQSLG